MKWWPTIELVDATIGDTNYVDHDGWSLEITWFGRIIQLAYAKRRERGNDANGENSEA